MHFLNDYYLSRLTLLLIIVRDAGCGGAGVACAPPSFGISINPIRTKGADYARHITTDDAAFL